MTPGNSGASTPEDDDPFGYLYADGQANGAQPPSSGYGYPNSVNRVRAVGQRQYGQQAQAPTAPYGQVPQQPQQGAYGQQQGEYGQPNAHYAAPETLPGGAPAGTRQPAPGAGRGSGGRGRGPNTKGLLIGAVAVVAAVVIGIGVAMMGDKSDDKGGDQAGGGTTPTATQNSQPTESASSSATAPAELPKTDAKALQLGNGATTASQVPGADADGGTYVTLNAPGAQVTWTVDGIPEDGAYTLFAHYSVPGDDQSMTLTVNGKPFGSKLSMRNYAHAAAGDFSKGWTTTFAYPTLNKGTNTISISCQSGDKCNALLDQLWLKKGQVTN